MDTTGKNFLWLGVLEWLTGRRYLLDGVGYSTLGMMEWCILGM